MNETYWQHRVNPNCEVLLPSPRRTDDLPFVPSLLAAPILRDLYFSDFGVKVAYSVDFDVSCFYYLAIRAGTPKRIISTSISSYAVFKTPGEAYTLFLDLSLWGYTASLNQASLTAASQVLKAYLA